MDFWWLHQMSQDWPLRSSDSWMTRSCEPGSPQAPGRLWRADTICRPTLHNSTNYFGVEFADYPRPLKQ
jgi:hypothetical protein